MGRCRTGRRPVSSGSTAVQGLSAWHTHLELIAERLRGGSTRPWPADRVARLREHYAERVEAR